ncbi:transposase [Streptomyces phaeoluteigriseus]
MFVLRVGSCCSDGVAGEAGSGLRGYFAYWEADGIFDQLTGLLRGRVRQAEGRTTEPSACLIDSQSIKTSATVHLTSQGIDPAKKIIRRKRHIVTDTLGLLLAVAVTAASVDDPASRRDGTPGMERGGGLRGLRPADPQRHCPGPRRPPARSPQRPAEVPAPAQYWQPSGPPAWRAASPHPPPPPSTPPRHPHGAHVVPPSAPTAAASGRHAEGRRIRHRNGRGTTHRLRIGRMRSSRPFKFCWAASRCWTCGARVKSPSSVGVGRGMTGVGCLARVP